MAALFPDPSTSPTFRRLAAESEAERAERLAAADAIRAGRFAQPALDAIPTAHEARRPLGELRLALWTSDDLAADIDRAARRRP
jgi:hypothetical protein